MIVYNAYTALMGIRVDLREWNRTIAKIYLLTHCFLLEVRSLCLLFFLFLLRNLYRRLHPIRIAMIHLCFLLFSYLWSKSFYRDSTWIFLSFPFLFYLLLIKLPLLTSYLVLLLIETKQLALVLDELLCKAISWIELPSSIYKEHSIPLLLLDIPHNKIFNYLWRWYTVLLNFRNIQPSYVNCYVFAYVSTIHQMDYCFILNLQGTAFRTWRETLSIVIENLLFWRNIKAGGNHVW